MLRVGLRVFIDSLQRLFTRLPRWTIERVAPCLALVFGSGTRTSLLRVRIGQVCPCMDFKIRWHSSTRRHVRFLAFSVEVDPRTCQNFRASHVRVASVETALLVTARIASTISSPNSLVTVSSRRR